MEVYLYGCEVCSTVTYSARDNGSVWATMCQVCRGCEFHEKINIMIKTPDDENEVHVFAIKGKKEEEV